MKRWGPCLAAPIFLSWARFFDSIWKGLGRILLAILAVACHCLLLVAVTCFSLLLLAIACFGLLWLRFPLKWC